MRTQLRRLELLLKVVDPPLYDHFDSTDSTNMFACFRWLLVLFKREFAFDEVQVLWEVIWTCPMTVHFHLFIALAILNRYRQELFECKAFDEVLKMINNLSQQIVVPEMIQHAEVLYYVFRERLVTFGPPELRTGVDSNQTEIMLCEISGVSQSDVLLDGISVPLKVTSSEWLELIGVLEF